MKIGQKVLVLEGAHSIGAGYMVGKIVTYLREDTCGKVFECSNYFEWFLGIGDYKIIDDEEVESI